MQVKKMRLTHNEDEWEVSTEKEAIEIIKSYYSTNYGTPDYISCSSLYLPDSNFIKYEVGNQYHKDPAMLYFFLDLNEYE